MTKEALIEKLESLPPEKRAEVERLIESLAREARPGATGFPIQLLERIYATREALFREQGPIETDSILRDLRENGGR